MKTITTNIYTFSELPPEAQARAIEAVREDEFYLDYPWHEYTIEAFVEDRTEEGWELTHKDVNYSGFWSQGDGASFDGKLDVPAYLTHHKLTAKYPLITKLGDYVWGDIMTNSYSTHYSHERTRYFQIDVESEETWLDRITEADLPAVREEMEALDEEIEADRLDLSKTLYRDLEKEYEYLMSDEIITDYLIINDYEFTIDGERH